jgi:hypothetical protein
VADVTPSDARVADWMGAMIGAWFPVSMVTDGHREAYRVYREARLAMPMTAVLNGPMKRSWWGS